MERKVRVGYVHTSEAASLDEIKKALWQQFDPPISPELLIHILDCEPVKRADARLS